MKSYKVTTSNRCNQSRGTISQKDGDGGDVFIVDTTNQQVGVNLSDPAVSLHVVDTNNPADGTVRVGSGIAYSEFKSNASGTGKLIINNYASSGSGHGILFQSNGSTNMTLTAGGSLGIGGTPTEVLDVTGNIRTSTQLKLDPTIASGSATTLAFMRSGANKWRFIQPHDDSYLKFYNDGASATQMYFASNNNIAIGHNTPSSTLHVKSTSADGYIIAESSHATSSGILEARSVADRDSYLMFREGSTLKAQIFNDSSEDSLVLTDGANSNTVFIKSDSLGIGGTPTEALHILSSEASATPVLLLENTNANNLAPQINLYKNSASPADGDYAGQIDFEGKDSAGNRTEYGRIITEQYRVLSGAEDGIMDLKVAVDGSLANGIRIRGGTGARVGIGSGATNPISNLEINGTIDSLDGVPSGLVVRDSGTANSGLQLINNSGKFAIHADGANDRVVFLFR